MGVMSEEMIWNMAKDLFKNKCGYDPNLEKDNDLLAVSSIMEGIIAGIKWQSKISFTIDEIDEKFFGEKGGYFDDFLDYRLGLNGNPINKISFKDWFENIKK